MASSSPIFGVKMKNYLKPPPSLHGFIHHRWLFRISAINSRNPGNVPSERDYIPPHSYSFWTGLESSISQSYSREGVWSLTGYIDVITFFGGDGLGKNCRYIKQLVLYIPSWGDVTPSFGRETDLYTN